MNCIQINCVKGRRLFDTFEGSLLHIILKCGNSRSCPLKADCIKTTEIHVGDAGHKPTDPYVPIRCPHCGKRLFDASTNSRGIVTIKCNVCSKLSNISILNEHFSSSQTIYGAPAHA